VERFYHWDGEADRTYRPAHPVAPAAAATPVPRVLGVDDFAMRKRHRYAAILIAAETREHMDVLPGRGVNALADWLREHPGVEVVCRDSSGADAQAIRRAPPDAVQVGDRWHIWHNLAEAVRKEAAAVSACWAKGTLPAKDGARAVTTRERWAQVHMLLDQGVGCSNAHGG
jgi:transposase